jgi:putative ABC transport system substrate-binding protein
VIDRRGFLGAVAAGVLATPLTAKAQPAAKVPRIAIVFANTPATELSGSPPTSPYLRVFLEGMRALGWIEGQSIIIDRLSAEGQPDRFVSLVDDVVKHADLMMITGPQSVVQRAKQARDAMPIVLAGTNDPEYLIQVGLVKSLARPGGSVTGLTTTVTNPEIRNKRLQLLAEAVPRARRVAYLGAALPLEPGTEIAAHALNLTLLPVDVQAPADLDRAFGAISRARVDAIFVGDARVFFWGRRQQIVDLVARRHLPAMYFNRIFADSGGLMSYGSDYLDIYRRAATYVDKILKGAKPGDLPIEQPAKFELVINLKTAKTLGLTIPQSLLLRADQVIE